MYSPHAPFPIRESDSALHLGAGICLSLTVFGSLHVLVLKRRVGSLINLGTAFLTNILPQPREVNPLIRLIPRRREDGAEGVLGVANAQSHKGRVYLQASHPPTPG